MGGSQSAFSEQDLEDYEDLTFFTKKEILHVYKRFASLDEGVRQDPKKYLPMSKVLELPELKVNPFRDRICEVFSSAPEKDGSLSFEDFLDMMSVFSDNAPKNVKVEYAFRIYDFDNDDEIGEEDLRNLIKRLVYGWSPVEHERPTEPVDAESQKLDATEADENQPTLNDADIDNLVKHILGEADLDEDNTLSFAEFEHVISKAPDFINSFHIRL